MNKDNAKSNTFGCPHINQAHPNWKQENFYKLVKSLLSVNSISCRYYVNKDNNKKLKGV